MVPVRRPSVASGLVHHRRDRSGRPTPGSLYRGSAQYLDHPAPDRRRAHDYRAGTHPPRLGRRRGGSVFRRHHHLGPGRPGKSHRAGRVPDRRHRDSPQLLRRRPIRPSDLGHPRLYGQHLSGDRYRRPGRSGRNIALVVSRPMEKRRREPPAAAHLAPRRRIYRGGPRLPAIRRRRSYRARYLGYHRAAPGQPVPGFAALRFIVRHSHRGSDSVAQADGRQLGSHSRELRRAARIRRAHRHQRRDRAPAGIDHAPARAARRRAVRQFLRVRRSLWAA